MEAYIYSIEFKKIDNAKCYWELTLIDENGNYIGKFGSPNISDPINFRKQTFGILSSCNCFDLVELGSSNPNYLQILIMEKQNGGVDYISSVDGKTFKLTEDGKYEITKSWNIFNKNKEIKKYNIGQIERIVSQSGVFTIWLTSKYYTTFLVSRNLYYGFGYPLLSCENVDDNSLMKACIMFKTFIEGILEIYGTNNLLKLSGNDNIEYPKIQVNVNDNGNIISISSLDNDYELVEDNDSYCICEKQKIKKR